MHTSKVFSLMNFDVDMYTFVKPWSWSSWWAGQPVPQTIPRTILVYFPLLETRLHFLQFYINFFYLTFFLSDFFFFWSDFLLSEYLFRGSFILLSMSVVFIFLLMSSKYFIEYLQFACSWLFWVFFQLGLLKIKLLNFQIHVFVCTYALISLG